MKYVALKKVESKMKPRFGVACFLVSLGIAIFLGTATNLGRVDSFAVFTNTLFAMYLLFWIGGTCLFISRVTMCYFRGTKMTLAIISQWERSRNHRLEIELANRQEVV